MKKILLVLAFLIVATLLVSCENIPPLDLDFPEEPKDMLPWCQEYYDTLLEQYPDLPQAYVGACVALFQSENPMAFVSLCGSETFWQLVYDEDNSIVLTSKNECIQYTKNQ